MYMCIHNIYIYIYTYIMIIYIYIYIYTYQKLAVGPAPAIRERAHTLELLAQDHADLALLGSSRVWCLRMWCLIIIA